MNSLARSMVRNVLKVSGGSIIGQLVAIAALPLLTRLYSPADYGAVSVYGAVVAIAALGATGRFERAILLPGRDALGNSEARALGVLSFRVLAWFCIGLALLASLAILADLNPWADTLGWMLLLIPLGVFGTALAQILIAVRSRDGEFGAIGHYSILQPLFGYGSQLALGILVPSRLILILGSLIGSLAGCVSLGRGRLRQLFRIPEDNSLSAIASKYSRFPRFELPFAVISGLSWSGVLIVLEFGYSAAVVGLYAVVYRILALPSGVLGNAIAQVYMREAAQLRESPSSVRLFCRMLGTLVLVALPLFALIGVFGGPVFRLLLGDAWLGVDEFLIVLLPAIVARFIGSPVTTVFSVFQRQGQLLAWQIVHLIVTIGGLFIGIGIGFDASISVLIFSLGGVCSYGVMTFLAFRLVKHGSIS